ncbi:MAG: hypothetical protein K5744_05475 [Eubacterium sp.]|nr:hypothetical protein [Eubacterium sp.]
MKAVMCNKNTELMEVEIEAGKITKIGAIHNRDLLPLGFKSIIGDDVNLQVVNKWMKKRCIPLDKRIGMTPDLTITTKNVLRKSHYFSLTDHYWFKYRPGDKWLDLNFFTNRYSESLGELYFSSWKKDPTINTINSPDITTNGVLRKRWTQDENLDSWLLKSGSVIYNQHPVLEVLASMMMDKLNLLPHVEYTLVIDNMWLCSKCKNFVDQETEFIPASNIYNLEPCREHEDKFLHLVKMCESLGITDAEDYLNRLITVDSILENRDRHLGNFGVLRNVETGDYIGFAPIFDSGSAFSGANKLHKKDAKSLNRLFEAHRKDALKYTFNKYDIDTSFKTDDIEEVLANYPGMSQDAKKAVRTEISNIKTDLIKCMEEKAVNICANTSQDKSPKKEKYREPAVAEFEMEIFGSEPDI